ncbi:hypothetical protein ES703_100145 [subsurface metagenome]
MIKVKNEVCSKCGTEIEFPDYDISGPFYDYRPKVERAIFKHFWQHHHEDFPPQFKSLTQFLKWLRDPQGQGLIAETREELSSDATEAGNDKITK